MKIFEKNLKSLVCQTFEPVFVKTKKGNAVIISQDDLNSLKETLRINFYVWN